VRRADGKTFVFNETGMQLIDPETHKPADLAELTKPVTPKPVPPADAKPEAAPTGSAPKGLRTGQAIGPTSESTSLTYGPDDKQFSMTYDKNYTRLTSFSNPRIPGATSGGVTDESVSWNQTYKSFSFDESISVDNPTKFKTGSAGLSYDLPLIGGTASFARGNYMKEASYTRDVDDNTSVTVTHDMVAKQQTYEAERKVNKRLSVHTSVTPKDHDTTAKKPHTSTVVGININLKSDHDGQEKKKKN